MDKTMKKHLVIIAARADSICARLNAGLTAVAIMLAVVVAIVATYRAAEAVESALPDAYSTTNPS